MKTEDIKVKIKQYFSSPKNIAKVVIAILFIVAVWDLFIRTEAQSKVQKHTMLKEDSLAMVNLNDTAAQKSKPIAKTERLKKDKNTKKEELQKTTETKTKIEPPKVITLTIEYVVKKGDNLTNISKKYNIGKQRIVAENKLPNEALKIGQKLRIPIKAKHRVKSGESLGKIAEKYGSKKDNIMTANDLKKETELKAGTDLVIPY